MNQSENTGFKIRDKDEERRVRLGQLAQGKPRLNPEYSRFIRLARLILPIVAIIIAATVFSWGHIKSDDIIPVKDPAKTPKTIGKNELLKARFESTDGKKQPYSITARRAFQDEGNDALVFLDDPLADMLLNSGQWIAIRAQKGQFDQNSQQLFLSGDVRLFHDSGYQMETQKLYLDLQKNTARSKVPVHAQGPAGTLEAKGLKGDNNKELLIFTGPAKLILNRFVSKNKIGELP